MRNDFLLLELQPQFFGFNDLYIEMIGKCILSEPVFPRLTTYDLIEDFKVAPNRNLTILTLLYVYGRPGPISSIHPMIIICG